MDELKKAAAEAAAALVEDHMLVGLGSGSTALLAIKAIGRRVAHGLKIIGIPTSELTARLARDLGIRLTALDEHEQIDLTIDGADEVELGTLNLIKGRGGALLREKIVACSSRRLIIVVDETKLVDKLAIRDAIPVEVVQFGWQTTARRLRQIGAEISPRKTPDGNLFVTDGGHYILDCLFTAGRTAAEIQRNLDSVVGVVEHGLFLGIASQVVVGGTGGTRWLNCSSSH
jgi:ribose 5-phosphate isomerase A